MISLKTVAGTIMYISIVLTSTPKGGKSKMATNSNTLACLFCNHGHSSPNLKKKHFQQFLDQDAVDLQVFYKDPACRRPKKVSATFAISKNMPEERFNFDCFHHRK